MTLDHEVDEVLTGLELAAPVTIPDLEEVAGMLREALCYDASEDRTLIDVRTHMGAVHVNVRRGVLSVDRVLEVRA